MAWMCIPRCTHFKLLHPCSIIHHEPQATMQGFRVSLSGEGLKKKKKIEVEIAYQKKLCVTEKKREKLGEHVCLPFFSSVGTGCY